MGRPLAALLLLAAPACSVPELDLAMKSCPCVSGWTCDEATDTCVAEASLDAGRDAAQPDGGERDAGPGALDDAFVRGDAGRDSAMPSDAGAAPPFTPSNAISPDLLAGADAELVISGLVRVDVETGAMVGDDGRTIRGGGTGVVDGIGYHRSATGIAVIAVRALSVEADGVMRLFGPRPVAILSAGDVSVAGTIDVSAGVCPDGSALPACAGPGGGNGAIGGMAAVGCAPGGRGDEDGDTGGGGGGLGTDGARGGRETDDTMGPPGLAGVVASPPCPGPELVPFIGGSGGGRGGGSAAAAGGGGGGALQLTAFGAIRIDGAIDAGGGGGAAPATNSGAGGGGSGGAVLIEALSVDLTDSVVAANGGGGGEGGASAAGSDGLVSATPAPGGDSGSGAAGGNGGALGALPTEGQDDVNDTGGGGGAAGIVRILATDLAIDRSVISPAPTTASPAM